jgi:hypothetical protein
MANLFAAPLVSALKHYRMVTPTEFGKSAEINVMAVSHLSEKPFPPMGPQQIG